MIVYRISNEAFKNDISGNGGAIYGSRWNSPGRRLLYTSEYISLSILESLVHLDRNFIPDQFLLHIGIPDIKNAKQIANGKIKKDWRHNIGYTQWIGDQFIISREAFALKVPSAIVEEEHNLLLNPLHAEFKRVKIIKTELLQLDKRLFQPQSPGQHYKL
jgi:RES domain-containing protein